MSTRPDPWFRALQTVAEYYAIDLQLPARTATGDGWRSPPEQYALWQRLVEDSPLDSAPVTVGRNIRLSEFGVVAAAHFSAPTLDALLDYYCDYLTLMSPLIRISRAASADRHSLLLGSHGQPVHDAALIAQMTVIARFFVQIAEPWQRLLGVDFNCRPPQLVEAYAEAFPAPLRFNAGQFALHFDRREIKNPLPGGHAGMFRAALQTSQAQLQSDLTASVRAVAASMIGRRDASGTPRLSEVAEAVHLSARSLQRHLADEGLNFSTLIDEVQLGLACSHLGTGTRPRIADVARRSGFSDQAAFTRFFRRHLGCTPSQYRDRRPEEAAQTH